MKNLLFFFFLFLTVWLFAQNRVVINADLGKDTISRHIYGHFSERRCCLSRLTTS